MDEINNFYLNSSDRYNWMQLPILSHCRSNGNWVKLVWKWLTSKAREQKKTHKAVTTIIAQKNGLIKMALRFTYDSLPAKIACSLQANNNTLGLIQFFFSLQFSHFSNQPFISFELLSFYNVDFCVRISSALVHFRLRALLRTVL